MSAVSLLYNLILAPLVMLFENVYGIAYGFLWNYGLSIAALSLAMNLLVLPLYRRADVIQADAAKKQKQLAPWVDHIRKNFKGDERYMITSAYYRETGYSMLAQTGGMLPLLLEIPFFLAAYRFLSNYDALNGIAFGPIRDLGAPDALLVIGGVSINLLPVLMTVINIISGVIYTKDMPKSSFIQLVLMALVFLVLLYTSPSGLVFYWTLNNLFSLVKNIFYKIKHPLEVIACMLFISGGALLGYVAVKGGRMRASHKIPVIAGAVIFILIALFIFFRKKIKKKNGAEKEYVTGTDTMFVSASVFITILTGLLIPSAVIASSPVEFVSQTESMNPAYYLLYSLPVAAGTFLLWASVFYFLAEKRSRHTAAGIYCGTALAFAVQYICFKKESEMLTVRLAYEKMYEMDVIKKTVNILVFAAVILVVYFICKKVSFARASFIALSLASAGLAFKNIYVINSEYKVYENNIGTGESGLPEINLSRTGKNVIVVMLDRAIDGYVPYIMNERPDIKEKFDGFTWYPNALSFGTATNFGAPGLFGGYEYTPEELNKRSDELLVEKHDEALKLLPEIFGKNGSKVTIIDPPYAGYSLIPDLSIYEGMENVSASYTGSNAIAGGLADLLEVIKKENFFRYALYRVMPFFIQDHLYDDGYYHNDRAKEPVYMDAYYVLDEMPEMTCITDDEKGGLLLIANNTAHDVQILQKPDYTPVLHADNTSYHSENELHDDKGNVISFETNYQEAHYDCNLLAYKELGEYFDKLREWGVYDNTRIILVSDHGTTLEHLPGAVLDNGLDVECFNCLFMVKDYNASGFHTDESFMTNADTPSIVLDGIVDDPVNPFTGNVLNTDQKSEGVHVMYSDAINVLENNGYVFEYDESTRWYEFKGQDVFDEDNWKEIERRK